MVRAPGAVPEGPGFKPQSGRSFLWVVSTGVAHWHAVKHLLRYLKGTADYSITYAPDSSRSELFRTYSDAVHGGCKDTGCSTGGYLVKIGIGAVS